MSNRATYGDGEHPLDPCDMMNDVGVPVGRWAIVDTSPYWVGVPLATSGNLPAQVIGYTLMGLAAATQMTLWFKRLDRTGAVMPHSQSNRMRTIRKRAKIARRQPRMAFA